MKFKLKVGTNCECFTSQWRWTSWVWKGLSQRYLKQTQRHLVWKITTHFGSLATVCCFESLQFDCIEIHSLVRSPRFSSTMVYVHAYTYLYLRIVIKTYNVFIILSLIFLTTILITIVSLSRFKVVLSILNLLTFLIPTRRIIRLPIYIKKTSACKSFTVFILKNLRVIRF